MEVKIARHIRINFLYNTSVAATSASTEKH